MLPVAPYQQPAMPGETGVSLGFKFGVQASVKAQSKGTNAAQSAHFVLHTLYEAVRPGHGSRRIGLLQLFHVNRSALGPFHGQHFC